MVKFPQVLTANIKSLNSWWVETSVCPAVCKRGQIKQCSSIGSALAEALIGELWCWFLFFIFIPLTFTLFVSSHTGFYYIGVSLVNLLALLADPFLVLACVVSLGLYISNFLRISLVGPFSMLVLALAGSAFFQAIFEASVSLAAFVLPGLKVVPFTALVLDAAGVSLDAFYVIGAFSLLAVLFLAGRTLFLSSNSSIRRVFWQNRAIDQLVLLTMAFIFSVLLLIANNFLFLFLAWVGLNLSLYGMLAQFSFSLKAQEAAIKYFILGLISAGFFLFGIWLLYVAYGSIEFYALAALIVGANTGVYPLLGIWGAALILSVLLFKLSAFPFQAWALDVYEGSSWFALAILVLLVKPVFLIVLIKTLVCFSGFNIVLGPIVFVSGVASLIVGTVGAAFQQKIKRFLSMSSISHIGFMLVLLGLDFSNHTLALNYLGAYLVANFIILAIVSSARISGPLYPVSRSVVYWSELAFLNGNSIFRSPRTLAFSVALLSLAGLPPFLGFFTKLGFFSACVSKLTTSSLLACFVGLASMPIGVYNYLRIIRVLWVGDCSNYRGIFFVNILSNRFFNLVVAGAMCILVFGGLFVL